MSSKSFIFMVWSLFFVLNVITCLENRLARTPPMGWLSWERFRCNVDCEHDAKNCISEGLIRDMAERLDEDGFSSLGYTLVGIDDCWLSKVRSPSGELQPDSKRFPAGMKDLGSYIHDRGLQFGIYGDIGTKTCGGYPGMQGNFDVDARTYADWGVDYLKVDGCYADPSEYAESYPQLGRALNLTGRPIVYSCSWPAYLPDPVQTKYQVPYKDLRQFCNLWRNWVDIQDSWESLKSIIVFWAEATKKSKGFQEVAGPGAWNDPDMLIIGNKGLDRAQSEVQMGMWAIFSAPLLMSNDLRDLEPWAKDILQNPNAIAINQDPLGKQGTLLGCKHSCENVQLWRKPLVHGASAVAFVNVRDVDYDSQLCVDVRAQEHVYEKDFKIELEDVFAQTMTNYGIDGSQLCIPKLKANSIRLFRLSRIELPEVYLWQRARKFGQKLKTLAGMVTYA